MSSGYCGIFLKKLKIRLENKIRSGDLDDIKLFLIKYYCLTRISEIFAIPNFTLDDTTSHSPSQ